jgi:hypothetical protein
MDLGYDCATADACNPSDVFHNDPARLETRHNTKIFKKQPCARIVLSPTMVVVRVALARWPTYHDIYSAGPKAGCAKKIIGGDILDRTTNERGSPMCGSKRLSCRCVVILASNNAKASLSEAF